MAKADFAEGSGIDSAIPRMGLVSRVAQDKVQILAYGLGAILLSTVIQVLQSVRQGY